MIGNLGDLKYAMSETLSEIPLVRNRKSVERRDLYVLFMTFFKPPRLPVFYGGGCNANRDANHRRDCILIFEI